MLRLPRFDYLKPKNIQEATRLLQDLGSEGMAVAGGTDVYPKMKRGQFTPRYLVSLRDLPGLRGIKPGTRSGLWIGAAEPLTAVSQHAAIVKRLPALAHAAGSVSTPPLRNVGTIGGNLFVDTRCNYYDQTYFWRQAAGFCLKKDGDICLVAPKSRLCLAVFSSDTAPVLCSMDAVVTLVSRQGERRVPVADLYRNDGIGFLVKEGDEVLKGITVPRKAMDSRSIYLKLRRRGSFDFPVLGVAAAIQVDKDGTCRSARIVLTAVASSPQVVDEAGQVLQGRKITPEMVDAAAEVSMRVSHPVDNADMDYWYRKRMTRVYVKRAIARLAGLP